MDFLYFQIRRANGDILLAPMCAIFFGGVQTRKAANCLTASTEVAPCPILSFKFKNFCVGCPLNFSIACKFRFLSSKNVIRSP